MPWLIYPMKEVQDCHKLWRAVMMRYYPEISEWENPTK